MVGVVLTLIIIYNTWNTAKEANAIQEKLYILQDTMPKLQRLLFALHDGTLHKNTIQMSGDIKFKKLK